ncbi:MAG: leucine-rich repeat domain-containing protein [Clostridia bacterium]|nr:leucine-rich repeat domain-containing protein [Clostridia bacterium]
MKKKILIMAIMIVALMSIFVISASAAAQNYKSYEVELVNGEKITVYEVGGYDSYEGRVYLRDTMYTEAPIDSEGTYLTLDWSQVKVLDFTNVWLNKYNSTTGEWDKVSGNSGSFHIMKDSFTPANAVNLTKIKTGKLTKWRCSVAFPELKEVELGDNLAEMTGNSFQNCVKLDTLTFSENSKLKTVGAHAFENTAFVNITFPNSLEKIGQNTFSKCTKLESVNFGASFINFNAGNAGQPPFPSSATALKYVYLPSTFTASAVRDKIFSWNDNNVNEYNKNYLNLTFFFTGTQAQAQAIIDAANGDYAVGEGGEVTGARVNTYIATMKLISAEDYKKAVADGTLETGVSGTPKRYLVYDYNLCEAFYNNQHIIKDSNDCTEDGDCDRCKVEAIVKGFETHNYLETFTYPNGFAQNGVYIKVCQNLATCTCGNITEGENTVKNPIFSALAENGYSTNGTGISFGGYVVDTDALKDFNNANKDARLTFGVVILNPKYLGETFFDENGNVNATKGYIKVDFSDTEYRNIKVMIDGFNTLSAKETELVIALYAYTDEAKVEFIQSEDTASASTSVTKGETSLYTVSVNSVMNKPNASVDALPPYENKENA